MFFFSKQKTVAFLLSGTGIAIFYLSVNLLTNVIVRLTTTVDYNDDNATDMFSVRAAASWALLIQIISKENS